MNQPVLMGACILSPVGVVSGPLICGGKNTRRLIFSAVANGQVTIWPVFPVVLGQGINLNQGTLPLVLKYEDWGDLIRGQWYAIGSIAVTIGVIDVQDCGSVYNDLAELGRLR